MRLLRDAYIQVLLEIFAFFYSMMCFVVKVVVKKAASWKTVKVRGLTYLLYGKVQQGINCLDGKEKQKTLHGRALCNFKTQISTFSLIGIELPFQLSHLPQYIYQSALRFSTKQFNFSNFLCCIPRSAFRYYSQTSVLRLRS